MMKETISVDNEIKPSASFQIPYKSCAILIIASVLVAIFYRFYPILKTYQLDLIKLQLIGLPLVLLVVLKLKVLNTKVPNFVIVFASFGAIASLYNIFLFPYTQPNQFIVAKIYNDYYETDSRIFRAGLNKAINSKRFGLIEAEGLRSAREFDYFSATDFLAKNKNITAITYGDKDIIKVSWQKLEPLKLDKFVNKNNYHIFNNNLSTLGLKLISSIDNLTMSRYPANESENFLAALLPASLVYYDYIKKFLNNGFNSHFDSISRSQFRYDLIAASQEFAAWRSYSHRALPLFQVANYELIEALGKSPAQLGQVNCAIRNYKLVGRFIDEKNHPIERITNYNNLSIALFIKNILEQSYNDNSKLPIKLLNRVIYLKSKTTSNPDIKAITKVAKKNKKIIGKYAK